jgi:hypothetical protein
LLRPTSGIEAPQQEKFYDHAYPCHHQRSHDRCDIEANDRDEQVLPDGIGDKGPKHVDGAMGEIEDPQDAKGEGKTRGDKKEQSASGNSTHELIKKNVKGHRFQKFQITNPKQIPSFNA